MSGPARILVRATNWVGDAVMSLPALRAVRQRFPAAEISVLARPWVAGLYSAETAVNRILPYEPASGFHDLSAKFHVSRALLRERFDCAILFQNAFEAAVVARLAGIPETIGYARDGRGFLLSRAIPAPRRGEIPPHESFYYLELLRRAGLIDALPPEHAIRLDGIPALALAGRRAFEQLDLPAPVIGVSPGAAYGSAKRWLPERFAAAAAQLAREHSASICLFGSPAESALCDGIVEHLRAMLPDSRVCSLAGRTTLRSFIEAAAACLLFLTNDSGAMHLASALGVPTVAIFGATNHITTGPTGPLARVVREPVSCSPCLLRECPIDHRCMTSVSVARVVDAAGDLLSIAKSSVHAEAAS